MTRTQSSTSTMPWGTTLIEVLVVTSIFLLLMSMILGFYIYGTRATSRHEGISESYRRAIQHIARLETYLAFSRVYQVASDYVVYTPTAGWPLPPAVVGRWPEYATAATTVWIDTPKRRVVRRQEQKSYSMLVLDRGETIRFKLSADARVLVIQVAGGDTRSPHGAFSLSHSVVLENPLSL